MFVFLFDLPHFWVFIMLNLFFYHYSCKNLIFFCNEVDYVLKLVDDCKFGLLCGDFKGFCLFVCLICLIFGFFNVKFVYSCKKFDLLVEINFLCNNVGQMIAPCIFMW